MESALTLYGLSNCDTVRRARRHFDACGIAYRFHDFRRDGLPAQRLDAWIAAVGWQALVNTRGTSWRTLPAEDRRQPTAALARTWMLENPALIRRPLLERADGALRIGWDESGLADWLATAD